jgi:phosphocarrier protein HPr
MKDSGGGAPARPSRTVTIRNRRGLHARAAAKFVKLAETFEAEVTVRKNGTSVSGLSIMGLMMLAAGPGTQITIEAGGAEAAQAVEALAALVGDGFDEE